LKEKELNMVSDSERSKILEMIENGTITAEEGLTLLNALDETSAVESNLDFELEGEIPPPFPDSIDEAVGIEETFDNVETDVVDTDETMQTSAPPTSEDIQKWKRWWFIPLWIGAGITVISGLLMYWAYRATDGFGFWFACSWFPFLLGVSVLALAWGSKTVPWLHVRVQQAPGERPQRIAISFPLPVRLAVWGFRMFGHYIPNMEGVDLEEIITSLKDVAKEGTPLFVDVDEGERGEKVQVFIG
jgi:hypothetical protein